MSPCLCLTLEPSEFSFEFDEISLIKTVEQELTLKDPILEQNLKNLFKENNFEGIQRFAFYCLFPLTFIYPFSLFK